MKTIMILGAGIYQVPAIIKSREMGLRSIALSYYSDDPGLAIADRGYNVSTTDEEAVLKIAIDEHVECIMTIASEASAPVVAYVASKLGLPGIEYETAKTIANKYSLRRVLEKHGIEGPRFRQVSDVAGVISFLTEVAGPIMIKPMNLSGSKGVAKIVEPSEAEEKFEACLNVTKTRSNIFVEEYIEGPDIGGACLVRGGKFLFFELTSKQINDYFVPIAHFTPVTIDASTSSSVKALVSQVVEALGVADGIMDFDVRLGTNGPVMIELGGRLGGNCIPSMLSAYTGVDLIKEGIKLSLGQTNEIAVHYKDGICTVRILGARRSGRIIKIADLEDFVPAEDIIEAQFDYSVGDEVRVFDNGADRLGHMIFKSKTTDQVEERIRRLDEVCVVE